MYFLKFFVKINLWINEYKKKFFNLQYNNENNEFVKIIDTQIKDFVNKRLEKNIPKTGKLNHLYCFIFIVIFFVL